jgi:hypothetical protein
MCSTSAIVLTFVATTGVCADTLRQQQINTIKIRIVMVIYSSGGAGEVL